MIIPDDLFIQPVIHGHLTTPTTGQAATKGRPTAFTCFGIGSRHHDIPVFSDDGKGHRRRKKKQNFHAFIDGAKQISGDTTEQF
jgi:hypothetical protein